MAPESAITTAPRSLARLSFKGQARCTLGGVSLSRIFVRDQVPGNLFTQEQGYSSCTTLHGGSPINILCGPAEPCPTELRARGTYLVKIEAPAATSSSTEVVRRTARLVICAGAVRVRVSLPFTSAESGGSVSGRNRFVILVEETISHTDDEAPGEVGHASSESINLNVIGTQPGPGECASPPVREQEETIERY
jgi:hypothetical protein